MVEPPLRRPMLPPRTAPPYVPFQLHHGVFTARQCERVIAACSTLPDDDAMLEAVGPGEIAEVPVIRRSRAAWLGPDSESEWIYSKLAGVAQRANRRYGFELTGFAEDLQFTTYDEPGAFYTWHQDGLDATVAHRKLSMVVQLSDPGDYQGAALEFIEIAEDYDDHTRAEFVEECSRRGTVISFPSFEFHRVTALLSGTRHSLVAWISGPPFR